MWCARHAYQWEKCSNDFTKPSLFSTYHFLFFGSDALNKFLFSGTQYEKGMEALSSMDRVKQMEAIQGYNSMKSNLPNSDISIRNGAVTERCDATYDVRAILCLESDFIFLLI
mgnify:CR=1 FL=1